MKQYIQLTNEEIKRSFKLYVIAVLVMAAIELVSIVVNVKVYLSFINASRESCKYFLLEIDNGFFNHHEFSRYPVVFDSIRKSII